MSVLTDSTPESGAPAGEFDLLTPVEYVAPRANLLPPEIAERAALRKMQALLAAAVIACGGIVGAGYVTTGHGKAPAKAALAQAQSEQQTLAAQKAALAPAQAAHQQVLAAKQSLVAAMGSEVLWSNQLDTLRRRLPDGVRLSTLTVTPIEPTGTGHRGLDARSASRWSGRFRPEQRLVVHVRGSLDDDRQLHRQRSDLRRRGWTTPRWPPSSTRSRGMPGWGNVYLTNTSDRAPDNGIVTFSITANITPAALSHRYTNGS